MSSYPHGSSCSNVWQVWPLLEFGPGYMHIKRDRFDLVCIVKLDGNCIAIVKTPRKMATIERCFRPCFPSKHWHLTWQSRFSCDDAVARAGPKPQQSKNRKDNTESNLTSQQPALDNFNIQHEYDIYSFRFLSVTAALHRLSKQRYQHQNESPQLWDAFSSSSYRLAHSQCLILAHGRECVH